jgi:mono/diheme cytochrome c family protein
MKIFRASLTSVTVLGASLAIASPLAATEEPAPADAGSKLARGKYLVTIAGCNDCHTPLTMGPDGPGPDMSRMLSGHPESLVMPPVPKLPEGPWGAVAASTFTAWSGPWGVSFTANLTPDPETGLGRWTLQNFRDTLRTGRRMGRGRAILPPMPIPMYKNLTDDDIESIFTYLQSIPAVTNRVPEPLPPPEQQAPGAATPE